MKTWHTYLIFIGLMYVGTMLGFHACTTKKSLARTDGVGTALNKTMREIYAAINDTEPPELRQP
jgi:hypothetical protein